MLESNSADLNVTRLQAAFDAAPGNRRWAIEASAGKVYDFGGGDVFIKRPYVTLCGHAELANVTINLGALPHTAAVADIAGYPGGGSALSAASRLFCDVADLTISAATLSSNPAVRAAYARDFELRNLKAYKTSHLLYGQGPVSDNYSQAVARFKVINCDTIQSVFGVQLAKGTGNAVMHFADAQIIGGRWMDTLTSADAARMVRHLDAQGIDGLIVNSLFCFFSANGQASGVKSQNIKIAYATNVTLMGNQLFEAGEEAILLDHVAGAGVAFNVIAFPGQRIMSDAIRVTGGDNIGDIYAKTSLGGNTIEGPSGNGIRIDTGCDYVSVNPNSMVSLGTSSRFYGVGSPLGASAMDVSRAEARPSTVILPQASSAKRIVRSIDVTATGNNIVIEIGDAAEVNLRNASQLNIATFTRFGSLMTDPADEVTVIAFAGATKLYYGTLAGNMALPDGIHRNLGAGDSVTFKPVKDSSTGVTRLYPVAMNIIAKTASITTTGVAQAIDISDFETVLLSPAAQLSIASWNRNLKAITTMSHQDEHFFIVAQNGNTTLTYHATNMPLKNGADVVLAQGNAMKWEVHQGKLYEVWRNF